LRVAFNARSIEKELSVRRGSLRAIIRERVVAGMVRAKGTKSGKPIGRPAIHPTRRAAIRAAYEAGGVGLKHFFCCYRVRAH
jgi:hypothetical protein